MKSQNERQLTTRSQTLIIKAQLSKNSTSTWTLVTSKLRPTALDSLGRTFALQYNPVHLLKRQFEGMHWPWQLAPFLLALLIHRSWTISVSKAMFQHLVVVLCWAHILAHSLVNLSQLHSMYALSYWIIGHTLMTSIRRTRQHNTGSLAQSQSKFHVYTVILTELSVAMTTLYSGQFSRNLMKPGQYGVTLYQGEIAAATSSVNVNAGCTSSITLTSSLSRPSVVWSIGKYCVRDCIER